MIFIDACNDIDMIKRFTSMEVVNFHIYKVEVDQFIWKLFETESIDVERRERNDEQVSGE